MGKLSFRRRLLAIWFPERCAVCGTVVAPGEGVCRRCACRLPRVQVPTCPFCGRGKEQCLCRAHKQVFDRVCMPFYYETGIRRAVLRLKETGDGAAAAWLAGEMAACVRREYAGVNFAGVMFVPGHRNTIKRRGFNPSRILAELVAEQLKLPLVPALEKVLDNAPQKTLSRVERSGNVLGVFDLRGDWNVTGQTWLLVDDIITTGSTLNECAKMLKIYGAAQVYAAVAAGAGKNELPPPPST